MKKIKLYWNWKYVEEDELKPDDSNRWAIEGNIKIDCSNLEEYEWKRQGYATVALITQKGTSNADFLNHESLPRFNVRVNNVLERGNLFNTGYGNTSQFFDTIDECKEFASRIMNFHYDMLNRAEKE